MTKQFTYTAFAGALAITLAASVSSCSKKVETAQAKSPKDEVFTVQTTTIKQMPMASSIKVTGSLEGIKEATVQSETQGRILAISHTIGDRVGAGTPLVVVDNELKAIAVQQATAAKLSAEAALDKAKIDRDRTAQLVQQSAATKNQLELADLQVKTAEAQLKGAQSQESLAKRQLSDATIKAPFAGVIANRFVNQGETVVPGAKIEMLVDDSKMKFRMFVNELDIASLAKGDHVNLSVDALPGTTVEGVVTNISTKADQTRSYEVDVEVPNPTHALKSGMFARATVERENTHVANAVPAEAVIYSGSASQIYVVRDGVAHLQEVKVGAVTPQMVEIVDGVGPQDQVVIFGQGTLHDNARVKQ